MLDVQGRITAILASIKYTCTCLSKNTHEYEYTHTCKYSEYSSIQYSTSVSINLGKCMSTHTCEYILVIYLEPHSG